MASRSSLSVFILLFQVIQIEAQIINVAANKTTNQSSTYSDNDAGNAASSSAVDGDTNSEYNGGSCTHTRQDSPGWWCVDLQQVFNITNIIIYNRQDNDQGIRLQGFEIQLGSDDQCNGQGFISATSCYKDTTATAQSIYTIDRCNQQPSKSLSARTVFINVTGILTLCEVKIYTECKDDDCQCDNCETCNTTTGVCNSCKPGWFGTNCLQQCFTCKEACRKSDGVCNSGCVDGYWGNSCQKQCSNNCNNGGCRQGDGYCNGGCKVGWYGDTCNTSCNQQCSGGCNRTGVCNDCNNGRYGANCQSTCTVTNCVGNCGRSTGNCDTCNLKWYGTNCESPCSTCMTACEKSNGVCNGGCIDGYWGNSCKQHCSNNCNIGGCRQIDGYCNGGCKVGWYGTDCQQQCSNNCNDGGCRRVDGYCNNACKVGWYGDKCDTSCNQQCASGCSRTGLCNDCINGKYSTNCESTCIVTNCVDNCDRSTGNCDTCNLKWYDTNCQSSCFTCMTSCVKSNGVCNGACIDGYWGNSCKQQCSNNCNIGGCRQGDGYCDNGCKVGWYGTNCQQQCSNNCNDGGCRQIDGYCNNGCKVGLYGDTCDTSCNQHCSGGCNRTGVCNDCIKGRYGTNCQSKCIVTNCNGNCDRITGDCDTCTIKWYGTNCESPCSTCMTSCVKSNGVCNGGCIDGYWGNSCQQQCSNNCNNGGCRQIDGYCNNGCKVGWYGDTCDTSCNQQCSGGCNRTGVCKDCINGRYGTNCQSTCTVTNCNGNCDRITGQCASCKPGWYGTNCETICSSNCTKECNKSTGRCTECKLGIFGDDCNKPCPVNCLNNCTRDGGKCNRCKPNTVGLYCNSTCGTECQPITDGNQETCDRDGNCTECIVGRYGGGCNKTCSTQCDGNCSRGDGICTECIIGRYGNGCNKNCSTTCDSRCDRTNGRCVECIVGRYGDRCEKNCSTTCDGRCDRSNGRCSLCIKGYSGDTCDKNCSYNCTACNQDDIKNCTQCNDEQYYGTSCNYQCSSNCKNGSCYQENGDCLAGCVEGKMGMNCSDNCTWGFYGENCNRTCGNCAQNTTCEITRGSCGLVGCAEGYTGDTCQEETPSPDAVVIAVVVSVIVVGIVVIIIVSVVMLKRKRNKSNMPALESEDNRYENFTLEKSIIKHNTSDGTQETVYVNDARQAVYDNDVYVNDARPGLYENFQIARSKTCIDLKDLWESIQTKKQDKSFKPEYQKLPKDLCSPVDICLNDVNRPKNRYRNICAFDHTRVKLDIENDDPTSDYVNACYITGYGNIKNKYIAAQGPNDVNINDFVRMLWDVKTGKIAMVTNLHEAGAMKCLKYWPSSGKVKTFGKIKMELIAEDVLAHFTIRTLKISKEGCGSRIIKHCHYTSWPDKGVPTDMASLVEFRNKVLKVKSSQPGPMVVHCSAGIGRTGTFLALDYLIDEGKAEGSVDVFQCVSRMRKERVNMVQTDDQYVFLHEAILEWYIAGDTTTTVTDYQGVYQDLLKVKQSSGKCQLAEKFEMMGQVCPKYTDADYSTALLKENKIKNRVPSILAYENTRILLTIPVPNTTDYINAVYIPSYKKKRAYILTQTPLANTVIDFWRMVVQKESQTIVHMDHGQNKTKGIGQYLPGDKPLTCKPFTITKTEEIEHEFYTIITCQVTGNSQDKEIDHTVRIYQCTFWKGEETTPKSSTPFFTLLEHIQSWTYDQKENPIIVHCRNGVNKGGLFCVLAAILERLTIEQDVSVLQTIIQLRVSRPQIITCYDQVKFCFDSVGNYLDNFSTYANSC